MNTPNLLAAPRGVNHFNNVEEEPNPSMRLSFSHLIVVPLALALTSPTVADAQSIASPFIRIDRRQEFGPIFGHMSAAKGRFGYAPSGGTLVGARYAIELAGPLSFEGVLGFVNGTRDVVDPGRVEGDRVIGEADSSITTVDVRFRFSFPGRRTWHRFSPFLSAGGGMAFDHSASTELDDAILPEDVFDFGSSFFGTIGLGSRFFLSDGLALRAEAVFSLWKVDTPPGFADPNRGFVGVSQGEWLEGTSLIATLLYRW